MSQKDFRSWGEGWNPGIKLSRGLDCPNCGWAFAMIHDLEKFNSIVGFFKGTPFETRGLGIKVLIGVLILECPECFEKYCFHTDANYANLCLDYCDKWPK